MKISLRKTLFLYLILIFFKTFKKLLPLNIIDIIINLFSDIYYYY